MMSRRLPLTFYKGDVPCQYTSLSVDFYRTPEKENLEMKGIKYMKAVLTDLRDSESFFPALRVRLLC